MKAPSFGEYLMSPADRCRRRDRVEIASPILVIGHRGRRLLADDLELLAGGFLPAARRELLLPALTSCDELASGWVSCWWLSLGVPLLGWSVVGTALQNLVDVAGVELAGGCRFESGAVPHRGHRPLNGIASSSVDARASRGRPAWILASRSRTNRTVLVASSSVGLGSIAWRLSS